MDSIKMETVTVILFFVLIVLVILETIGYSRYIEAQKTLVEAYKNQSGPIIALITLVNNLNAKLDEHIVHVQELESDNDVMRTMIDTLCDVAGIKLPHLQAQLHKDNRESE